VKVISPASERLSRALVTLAEQNFTTPCQGDDGWLFLAEEQHFRDQAIPSCRPCPVRDVCADAAVSMRVSFGVWASKSGDQGHDYTIRPGKARRKTAA
jgi:hypothetical protein